MEAVTTMKFIRKVPKTCFAGAVLVLLGGASPAAAKLSVVATTPELGAVAAAVGGDAIGVMTLAKATEDPHFVDARPTHIVTLNRADVLIEGGAELEIGWLPPLVEGARNAKIQPGAPGRILASEGIQLLDIPASFDRSRGDIHGAGNPHFMMDPQNAIVAAGHMAEAFCTLDSTHCAAYEANLSAFKAEVENKMKEWSQLLAPYRGAPIVTYHATWRYFAARFGLKSDLYLEPKPGIPPSPPHLAEVMEKMKAEGIRVILVEPYQTLKVAETVAGHTGATVVRVAQFPGALPGTEGDYIALMDANVKAIAAALAGKD
jgi:zinc/manganese transport system substrate-binding protein